MVRKLSPLSFIADHGTYISSTDLFFLVVPPLPCVVELLAGEVTATSFLLTWCHPPMDSNSTCYAAYVLEYWETDSSSPPCSISLAGRVKEHTVTGLKPQTTYYVKMAAENAAGRGPFCEALPVQTKPDSEYQYLMQTLAFMVLQSCCRTQVSLRGTDQCRQCKRRFATSP